MLQPRGELPCSARRHAPEVSWMLRDTHAHALLSPQVEYSLDRDTKTATLVWSFSYPGAAGALAQLEREDMFLVDGGSVYREDELYLVGFTVAKTDAATLGNHTRVFEVDNAGEARSQMAFPSGASTWNSGAWRFLPVADLCGESTECPFDDGEDACS